jgi:HAD superfamily phosphatase (TIGR01668 family)
MVFLRPTICIDGDITDIDLEELRQSGIKGIILDLDSTLVAPRSGKLTPAAKQWLEAARENFLLAVVSNNKKTDYLAAVQKLLAIPVVGDARKPSKGAILSLLQELKLPPSEAVLVGDRPLTDVWAGARAGMRTILVKPLKSMNEPSWIKFCRKLERLLVTSS